MRDLPYALTTLAFQASNGELAWRRADIASAVIAMRDSQKAILAGEIWLVGVDGTWTGLIPDRSGGPSGIHGWVSEPRMESESWKEYCDRTLEVSLHALHEINVEQETLPELAGLIWFNVSYIGEYESPYSQDQADH